MKHAVLVAFSLPFLASCSTWDDLISRDVSDPALPGVPLQISCNPEPTLIYSKTGQLIDTVIPVLHPSCSGSSALGVETAAVAGPWWTRFGPPSSRASFSPNVATDDNGNAVNPRNVATDDRPSALPKQPDTPGEPVKAPPVTAPPPTPPATPTAPPETPPSTPTEPEVPETPTPAPPPPVESGCSDADECHDHPDHDPDKHDNSAERVKVHGMSG